METEVAATIFPTPTVSDTEGAKVKNIICENGRFYRKNKKGIKWGVKLRDVIENQMLPTPQAHEARLGYQRRDTGKKGTQKSLSTIIIEMEGGREKTTGQLNPMWVEWLMGFNPLGWTELKHSEIQSFPKLQKSLERQLSRMRNKNGTKIQKNKT